MALEGALEALGGASRSGGNPAPIRFTAAEDAENAADVRSPESRAALEGELKRPNLHPVARSILQKEYDTHFGQGATTTSPAVAANDDALSGALAALTAPIRNVKAAGAQEKAAPSDPAMAALAERRKNVSPIDVVKAAGSMALAPGAAIAGGYEGMWTIGKELAAGKSWDEATKNAAHAIEARQKTTAFEPDTEGGQKLANMLGSNWNPMNWPAIVAKKLGETAQDVGAPPAVAALTEGVAATAPMLLLKGADRPIFAGQQTGAVPLRAAANEALPAGTNYDIPTFIRNRQSGAVPVGEVAPGAPTAAPATRVAATPSSARGLPTERVSTVAPPVVDLGLKVPEAGTPAAAVEAPAVKGGLPAEAQAGRAAVLQRLGITKAWDAAVKGDALEGATNAQTARFDQPAGRAAAAQFASETAAIEKAASEVATKAGGTLGTGEAAAFERGSKITKPFDKLRQWFDEQTTKLYKAADEKTGGLPVVAVEPIEALLKDRSFKNSVMAKDKGHLLTAIDDQLALFKENNPQGLTVKNAEQFRQWLNQQWTHENSHIIGQVKTAVDKAVSAAAGEDVYASSRAMHILKKSTLEDPKGIARLMDVDPKNPINRATALEKIPTTIERLSIDQFKNLVDTLRKKMPPEMKADAAAAEAQMKAHFMQGLIEAGTPNTKTPSPFWNNRRVNDFLAANEEKMSYLFSKAEKARIADIRAGGNIIAVDASYPGAAAQAANAAKQGLMSRIISPALTTAGGGAGAFAGSIFGMPAQGGAAGAALGRMAGEKMSAGAAERSALKGVQNRMRPLSEIGAP